MSPLAVAADADAVDADTTLAWLLQQQEVARVHGTGVATDLEQSQRVLDDFLQLQSPTNRTAAAAAATTTATAAASSSSFSSGRGGDIGNLLQPTATAGPRCGRARGGHVGPVHNDDAGDDDDDDGGGDDGSSAVPCGATPKPASGSDSGGSSGGSSGGGSGGGGMECIVCFDHTIDTALYPCWHIVLCSSCALQVTKCPQCRRKIQFRQRVYVK